MALRFVERAASGGKTALRQGGTGGGTVVPIRPVSEAGPETGSRLGVRTRFRGEILGSGSLVIGGQMEGSIRLRGDLTVERRGRVHAEMGTGDAVFRGRVSGSLNAQGRVRIHRDASFHGQVLAERLQVQVGGILHGKVCVPQPSGS